MSWAWKNLPPRDAECAQGELAPLMMASLDGLCSGNVGFWDGAYSNFTSAPLVKLKEVGLSVIYVK